MGLIAVVPGLGRALSADPRARGGRQGPSRPRDGPRPAARRPRDLPPFRRSASRSSRWARTPSARSIRPGSSPVRSGRPSFLDDPELVDLAEQIYNRVDWRYWSVASDPETPWLIRHGKGPGGRFLPCSLGPGQRRDADDVRPGGGRRGRRALPGESWKSLRPFYGEVAGHRFNNADLGLFVFQYGLDLLDLRRWRPPDGLDLVAEASVATLANRDACRASADRFRTYRRHWGLSAGDGPGTPAGPGRLQRLLAGQGRSTARRT